MIRIVPASPAHVGRIAVWMREQDRRECAAFGRSPKEALRLGLRASVLVATAFLHDRPIAMFGVTPISVIEGVGRPWLLGTDDVPICAKALLSDAGRYIEAMHARFRRLENMVLTENRAAMRMLKRWGFTVEGETVDVGGVAFVPFWRES